MQPRAAQPKGEETSADRLLLKFSNLQRALRITALLPVINATDPMWHRGSCWTAVWPVCTFRCTLCNPGPPISYVCSFPSLINIPRANRHHSLQPQPRAVLIALWILALDVQNTVQTVFPWIEGRTQLWRGCTSVLGQQDGRFTGKSNRFLLDQWISKHSCSSWGGGGGSNILLAKEGHKGNVECGYL